MNVAFVADVMYPFVKGGGEKRIYEIGTRLADRGHEVTVYSRHWWDGPATLEFEGMTLRAVAPAGSLYAADGTRSITGALGFAARCFQPLRRHASTHDLVVSMAAPYFHDVAAALATWSGPPLAITWHEVWLDHWDEYLDRFAFAGKLVERSVARLDHQPITVSQFTADRLAGLGVDPASIAVVPNGIDFDRISGATPAASGFDLLYVGRLIADKNVDLVLSVFDVVAADRDVTLGIVGDGPQRDSLEAQARDLEHGDRVTFTGSLEAYDDVLGHMQAADVFVSPSVREGFGLTLLEAMAADSTVVTVEHPTSGAAEVVADAGFVTEPTEPALVEAVGAALDGARPAMPPRERARTFDWERVVDQAEELYSSVAAGDASGLAPPRRRQDS